MTANPLAPPPESVLLSPGEGRTFFVLSDWGTTKVRTEWTGGRFSVVEQVTVPGARPPLHTHEFDEIHYIIDGEYDYWQGDKPPRRATAGSVVWTPAGVPHTYKNVGTTNARLIAVFMPGGFERFFEECGVESNDTSASPVTFGIEEVLRLAGIVEAKYKTKVVALTVA